MNCRMIDIFRRSEFQQMEIIYMLCEFYTDPFFTHWISLGVTVIYIPFPQLLARYFGFC